MEMIRYGTITNAYCDTLTNVENVNEVHRSNLISSPCIHLHRERLHVACE